MPGEPTPRPLTQRLLWFVALWLGGGLVAATTAMAQFKQAILGLFHQ